ncbi:hypothetical protein GOODEAATRI_014360, partial [Goodea atripinnis]
LLRSQVPVQASLQILQELGEQLKQQVDTSAASAIQSDHLSLAQRLAGVEQALNRQLTALQLSLRRQQVSEKLNEWTVFTEKYKELCEWLTNMESKVAQNGDISIEEMIEKLRKVWKCVM